MISYNLNPNDAKEGSGRINSRIQEKGAYIGTFLVAKAFTNDNNTKGVEFQFKGNDGIQDRLTIYTHNKEGKELSGFKQLQAIMAVFRVRTITTKAQMIEEYDFDAGQKVQREAEVFPELMNKPVGVVVVMEEYQGSRGIGKRPIFYAPFDASTKQLAVEILEQKPAGNLDKMLAGLKDRPLRNQSAQPAPQGGGYTPPSSTPDWDQDIPF